MIQELVYDMPENLEVNTNSSDIDPITSFLGPSTASRYEAAIYLSIASLSAYIWDWIISMPYEYRMLKKKNAKKSLLFLYFFSRATSLAYLLTSTLFQVALVESCSRWQVVFGWCFACAVPSSAALFYLRVRAVYANSRPVTIGFGVLWLCVVAGCVLVPFTTVGVHIGTTKRCIIAKVLPYSSSGIIIDTCYDTLIFVAISWRLMQNAYDGNNWSIRAFTRGTGLPYFTKLVMQSGQLYYLATVGMNILTMAMILSKSVPAIFRAMFTIPNVALENAMTTRAFRAISLGIVQDQLTIGQSMELSNFRSPNWPSDFGEAWSREHSRGRQGSNCTIEPAVPAATLHIQGLRDANQPFDECVQNHDVKASVV